MAPSRFSSLRRLPASQNGVDVGEPLLKAIRLDLVAFSLVWEWRSGRARLREPAYVTPYRAVSAATTLPRSTRKKPSLWPARRFLSRFRVFGS